MRSNIISICVAVLAAGVNAQQTLYGQCGGIGWTGATTCVSGSYCHVSGTYYSQCIPGTGSAASASALPSSTTPVVNAAGAQYLFSFGDSYSQTGFDITGTKPSSSNPFGNPAFPGYTTSGGTNWLGYLIKTYNVNQILDYNFAYGGATVDASLVAPYATTVLSFINQTTEFSNNVASKPSYAPWTSANSLFAVWLGVNDIGNTYGSSTNQATLHSNILDKYFAQLSIMYTAGGRRFVLLSVPPIQKTPLQLASSSSNQASEATQIAAFNTLLSSRAASFQSSHSGSTVLVYDTQAPFNTAIANPTQYGATNATCYNSDGTTCLWWNNYHPGMAIHKLVAQGVAATLKNAGISF